ncbi:SusC/RagA family TonB-linked outer membrane protein [Corallibacter sp.]|uniref:SusC/RagA family TonB-linked outer membrane protein n=1 Tax=Corallibacter sp. TaxID=2038084 RepID=UPI003A8F3D8C
MISKHLTLALFLIMSTFAFSQNVNIKGSVVDSKSQVPLPGVNIIIKNTTQGVSTDFDGNFNFENVPINSVLQFSFIGYNDKEVTVTNSNPLSISLEESTESLDEIVLIGYGSQNKKDVTGAVSLVTSETLDVLKPIEPALALQGTVSGVSIGSASGSPGSGYNIVIRGTSSNGSNAPLVIIDGYTGNLNSINPDDIESISILKDAQAAIYGIAGANGVVLVKTKSGKKNTRPTVSYDVYAGFQETTRKLPYLNATEYALLLNESYAANGQTIPYNNVSGLGEGIDWQDELFETAPMTNHNVRVTGGGENITYYFGAGRLEQDGIIASDKSNYIRNNIKLRLGVDITEKLKFSTTTNYLATERKTISENALGSVLFNALNYAPTYGLNEEDTTGFLGNEVINPLSQIRNTYNDYSGKGLEGNFQLEYKPIEGLTVTSRFGYKTYEDKGKNFAPIVDYGPGKVFNNPRSRVDQNRASNNYYNWETFFTYDKIFGKHHITFTGGTSVQKSSGDGLTASGFDVPANSWEFADIALTTGLSDAKSNSSYYYDNRLTSYFARLQYDFSEKYLLSVMFRRDASSDFPDYNRVDIFPSFTAGWKISEEGFLKNSNTINFLKLRGSYGQLGNDVGRDLYRATLDGEATYIFDGALVNGVATGRLQNPDAKWEIAEKFDVGFDLKLFNSKIDITADYFIEDREDLLVAGYPVSGILGTGAPGGGLPTVNAGETRVKGVEFSIGYKGNISEDFSFGVNYNFTSIRGEVTEINGDVIPEGGAFGVGQLAPARMEVGQPIGYFYGYQTNGIFQNQAEVDAHPSQIALGSEAAPGDFRFVDVNGDGVIDSNDRTYLGKPQADYYMGFNLNFKYKNFDFTAYSYAEIGKETVRNYERDQPNVNRLNLYLNRWTGEGTSNSVPRATVGATSNKVFSDFYVEDSSFLRIQNIQLGYSLSPEVLETIGMSRVRVYATVNNAFTFTNYNGYDPAATTGEAIGGGIDYGFYPVSRQYLLGLNLTF